MQHAENRPAPLLLPIALLMVAMACFQIGATLAKGLFPLVGATGATALRTGIAAIVLCLVWQPWRLRLTRSDTRAVVIYGIALGCMNLSFYAALNTIPLGIAVAIEFTGPLGVAVAASRRTVDFVWIALAAAGLWALLPLGRDTGALAPQGVALALFAGLCWALYIIYGKRSGIAHGGASTALGMLVSSMFVVPVGLARNGLTLLSPAVLMSGAAVAVVSSALPYSLEMIAMPRIPTRVLGVLLSLDPVLGALAGFVVLNEHLSVRQWAAIACIMVASVGSASSKRAEALTI